MTSLIILGAIVVAAFITIFFVHLRKVKEEHRIQTERKIQELQTQAKRVEPLVMVIRPHLLSHELRSALADRWIALLHLQQDAGAATPEFLAHLQEAEQKVREVKANPNPKAQPVENKEQGQEIINHLKSLQFLIMKEFREERLSESRSKQFLTVIRYAATQVVVEMNQSLAQDHIKDKKYSAALICYQNILSELKKYRGTEQEHFSSVYSATRKVMEDLKAQAREEMAAAPNVLAQGMEELEKEEAENSGFQSDMQRALAAGKAKARQSQGR